MKRVSREHYFYYFDKEMAPAMEVEPGETVVFETWDARRGAIKSEGDPVPMPSPSGNVANPATGPLFVRGARPGDAVAVRVEEVKIDSQGWMAIRPTWGVITDRVRSPLLRVLEVKEGQALLRPDLRFPVRPMIGVMGTAPAGDPLPTSHPGDNGSNMDNNMVREGSTVYLPVSVEGALLGIGDVHASMGDGEVTGTGIEICGEVRVTVDLLKGFPIKRPIIVTGESVITCGHGATLEEAVRVVTEDMAELLHSEWGISMEDAFLFLSAAGDVGICQACNSPLPVTTRCSVPKLPYFRRWFTSEI